jgi:alkanesulfonate monooxygenase SsuD/methylene tetrahydromethanopterin reductase-like flavin-dependent oxidoreductase (luciferase family)
MSVEGEYEPMRVRGYERPFAVARPVPVYLAAMGPLMTRLAGEIGDGWISHELSSPRYLAERVMPDLLVGIDRASRARTDLDIVVSACCSIDADATKARRRAAGLVAFYATVRTYADFFEFHGVAGDQQAVIDAFRAGTGADHLADAASDRMVDALTLTGDRDAVAERLAAYDGIADSVKLSPPTHGLPAADTRAAQDEIIALIRELNR